MITGFNTDVRHNEVVFHVQTEDKGTGNPCIESLVYVGGQILARKRAGYRSLLEGEAATKAVTELMEQQHRSMIAEIRSGKMDEKLAAIKGPSKAGAKPSTAVPPPAPKPTAPAAEPAAPRQAPAAEPPADASTVAPIKMPPLPSKPPPARAPSPPPSARPTQAGSKAVEEEDKSLDQVILDYLETESGQNKLVLSMDRRSGEIAAGSEVAVVFRTESSVDSDPIGQTRITVRLISTLGEPEVLGKGVTDDQGQLEMTFAIPVLKTGSGALIVSAESSLGYAEIRHLV